MSAISNPLEDQIKRSTTPAASEKVLLFLEGIERAGGAMSNPPSSIASHDTGDNDDPIVNSVKDTHIHAGSKAPSAIRSRSRAPSKLSSYRGLNDDWGHTGQQHADEDDGRSDEQVGRRSVAHSNNMANVHEGDEEQAPRHPSYDSSFGNLNLDGTNPADGPGPRYISGTSSFGNFGPLPMDNAPFGAGSVLHGWHQQQRTPMFAAGVPLPPESSTMSPRRVFQPTPTIAAGVPLPSESILMSPGSVAKSTAKSSSYHIDIQAPTPPGSHAAGRALSNAGSVMSRRSDRTEKNQEGPEPVVPVFPGQARDMSEAFVGSAIHTPASPLSRSRSHPPTEQAQSAGPTSPPHRPDGMFSSRSHVDQNLFSPKSNASRAFSGLSKPGNKATLSNADTYYPDLPASRAESIRYTSSDENPLSPPKSINQQPIIPFIPPRSPSVRHQQSEARNISSSASTQSDMEVNPPINNFQGPFDSNRPTSPFAGSQLGRAISAATHELDGLTADISAIRQAVTGVHPVVTPSIHEPEQSIRAPSPQMTRAPDPRSPPARSHILSPTKSYVEPTPSISHSRRDIPDVYDQQATPTQSRPQSPDMDEEQQILTDLLSRKARTRTSYATTALGADVEASHFHDQELCILLHTADDPMTHDVVRKVVKKAIRNRLKSLKMKHDPESIQTYKRNFHDHDPSWHEHDPPTVDEPPAWAKDIITHLSNMEQRVAALGPKIESLRSPEGSHGRTQSHRSRHNQLSELRGPYTNDTPESHHSHIRGQMTDDTSLYRQPDTEFTPPGESTTHGQTIPGSMHRLGESEHENDFEDENGASVQNGRNFMNRTPPTQDGTINEHFGRDLLSANRNESPGEQFLEEQLFKLRVRDSSQSQVTHNTWEIAREGAEDEVDDEIARQTTVESELPEIAGSVHNGYDNHRRSSPPLPPIPMEGNQSRDMIESMVPGQQAQQAPWAPTDAWTQDPPTPPPWQRIHQRLLNWAIVWPMSDLDAALNSTNRGYQIEEVALSIWSTQQYKRYVRNQLTEVPPGRVDRLFVPPNMADAINNAVFHGRHGEACGMLRDLWAPFGLEGMPRIIIVLCKHRGDVNHWVAHKFSLPDGTLTTYDTYPEKSLPDGRPLGWWFAIRIAWPTAMYPSPDHLMQKMVRLHRPMQLAIDNSVAAAGIWRNLLMSSRAERPLDLERLRDLINTEVKNLRQRKEQGKLSVTATRPKWEMAI